MKTAQLSQDDILHLAELAKLKLTPAQLEKLKQQIPSILANMNEIGQLNLEGISDVLVTVPANNYIREDVIVKPLSQTEALQNTQFTYKGYIVVPGIFAEE